MIFWISKNFFRLVIGFLAVLFLISLALFLSNENGFSQKLQGLPLTVKNALPRDKVYTEVKDFKPVEANQETKLDDQNILVIGSLNLKDQSQGLLSVWISRDAKYKIFSVDSQTTYYETIRNQLSGKAGFYKSTFADLALNSQVFIKYREDKKDSQDHPIALEIGFQR